MSIPMFPLLSGAIALMLVLYGLDHYLDFTRYVLYSCVSLSY